MGKPDMLSRRANHGTGSDDNSNVVLLPSELFAIPALEGLEFVGPERDILRDIRKGSKRLDQDSDKEPVANFESRLRACFVRPNGQNTMAFFTIAVASTSLRLLTFDDASSPSVTTQ